ncbi:MAG: hypothetical protein JOZ69_09800, partial [Myxococcales bacterium]|nr:hypothetical protein [Myxococcales bacterium]
GADGTNPGASSGVAGNPAAGGSSGAGSSSGSGSNSGSGSGSGAVASSGGSSGSGSSGGNGSGGNSAGGGPSSSGAGSTTGDAGSRSNADATAPAAGGSSKDGGADAAPPTGSDGGCGTGTAVVYPALPGAVQSTLYSVSANGSPLFVEHLTKFAPEMQVHYAHLSLAGGAPASFSVTVSESFSSYTLSPKSRNIATSRSGNTITFCSGPNYLILAVDAKELLFILIDDAEANPPRPGDADVKSIADYNVDNTGATLVTSRVQAAIDAASGATQNILYFPPGRYLVGELWLRSNMTLYLAGGAVLYGSNAVADFNTGNASNAGVNIEGTSDGMIRLFQIQNTKILGRGVIDSNGKSIRAQGLQANLIKIEGSSNILIDGIVSRDSSYWNTLVYESDLVTIQNYKVINVRPTTTTFNQTDGVDFDESTNGHLSNAFLYTGDDNMATKNEFTTGHNIKNILHEKVVGYSNSVCAKIGTKTLGQTMDGVVFKDIDVVKAGRALAIDAYDTAVVENTTFENVRIEAADSNIVDLNEDMPPTFRTAANMSVTNNTTLTNVTSDVKLPIILHGKSPTININGVHFSQLTVQGHAITSVTDPNAIWDINADVSGVTVGP